MNPELLERSDAQIKVELYAVQCQNKIEKQRLIEDNWQRVKSQWVDNAFTIFALTWIVCVIYTALTL